MEPLTNFSIFRNLKKTDGDNKPDYTMSAKIVTNNTDEYKDIGAVYIKETKTGQKFFSCSLKKPFGEFDGYVIVTQKQYNAMKQAWDDWQIKLRNPDYPVPTELGIDITPEDLDKVDF